MLYGKSPFFDVNANMMYGRIMEEEPSFPKEFKYSDDSTDLIKKLLKKSGADRIGYDDEQEVFTHPWFNDIDFAKLIAKKLPAMIIPHVDEKPWQRESISTNGQTSDGTRSPPRGQVATDIELSFMEEEKHRKMGQAAAKLQGLTTPGCKMNESYEDFSYFEEEDHVETAMHHDDEDDILDEEFEEERRIQLLTNIEECSDENLDTKDALDSPKNEEVENRGLKNQEVDDKYVKRKSSVDAIDAVKINEKIDRKGSDVKPQASVNGLKRNDSLEVKINQNPIQLKRETQSKPTSVLELPRPNTPTPMMEIARPNTPSDIVPLPLPDKPIEKFE